MTTRRRAPRTPQSVQLAVALCASALLFIVGSGLASAAGTGSQPQSAGPIVTERSVDFAATSKAVEPSPQHGVTGVQRANGVPVAAPVDPGNNRAVSNRPSAPASRRPSSADPAPRSTEQPKAEKPQPPKANEDDDDDADDHETVTPPIRDEDKDDEDAGDKTDGDEESKDRP